MRVHDNFVQKLNNMNAQIMQYGQLLSGLQWQVDARIQPVFFASNLTGVDPIASVQINIWQRISTVFFVLYFVVLVCASVFLWVYEAHNSIHSPSRNGSMHTWMTITGLHFRVFIRTQYIRACTRINFLIWLITYLLCIHHRLRTKYYPFASSALTRNRCYH